MTTGADSEQEGDVELIDLTPERSDKRERPWESYTVEGVQIRARQPKDAFYVLVGKMHTGTDAEKVRAIDTLVDRIFDKESAKHLHGRLDDDDDEFDIDEVSDVINKLVELWGGPGRPTGPSGGSARRSGNPRKRSTVRRR